MDSTNRIIYTLNLRPHEPIFMSAVSDINFIQSEDKQRRQIVSTETRSYSTILYKAHKKCTIDLL